MLLISFMLNFYYWSVHKIPLMFGMFVCLNIIFIGYMKHSEPKFSYQLRRSHFTFIHRVGYWRIFWSDIIRIGDVNTTIGAHAQPLPYIGIKLKSLKGLASSISPRLANRLIHEQQELLILAVKNREHLLDNGLINFAPFVLDENTFKGPVAAWLHQTELFQKIYGYHLFLPESSFDRERAAFLSMLKKCQYYANITDT